MEIKHTFVILAYQESDDLEDCIKSIINQSVPSNIVIATSTPSTFITDLASDYSLGVMVNKEKSNKGADYNFALSTFNTDLLTIAHQDDLYDRNYAREVIKCYEKNKDASIIFSNYYEIHKDVKVKHSKMLFLKKMMIWPLRFHIFQDKKRYKLRSLKYGQCFSTSAVTFIKKNVKKNFFPKDLKYYNDWQAFINLALLDKKKMVYLPKRLVGYRVEKKEFNKQKQKEREKILKKLWPDKVIDFLFKKYHNNY